MKKSYQVNSKENKEELLAENIEAEILDDGLNSYWVRYRWKDKPKKPKKAEEIVSRICDEVINN